MILREMLVDDLEQVMKIEIELFSPPWTKEGFFTYLTRKDAMFLVVEEKGEILAYCGLLMVLDEGDNPSLRKNRIYKRRDPQKILYGSRGRCFTYDEAGTEGSTKLRTRLQDS